MANKGEKNSGYFKKLLRLSGFVIGLILIIVIGGIVYYPLIPTPTVQGYLFKGASRDMSVNAPFQITFNQMMNHSSVEKVFQISPKIEGEISWRGNTLIFTPKDKLNIGDEYTITIGKSALSLLQKPLNSEYSEVYRIIAAPKVALITPNDQATNVLADSKINILFDRPVGTMSTIANNEIKIPDIKIEPKVSGKWRWLGTSGLQFTPDKLKLSTSYKVTVPKGMKVLDGGFIEDDYISHFETVKPFAVSLTATDSLNSVNFSNQSRLKLTFNIPVDIKSAKEMISLVYNEDGKDIQQNFQVRYFSINDWLNEEKTYNKLLEMDTGEEIEIDDEFGQTLPDESELIKSLIIETTNPLKRDYQYNLTINAGLRGQEGSLATEEAKKFNFTVSSKFNLVEGNTDPLPTDNKLANVYFKFNNPINLSSFDKKVVISPQLKDENGKVIEPILSNNSDRYTLNVNYNFQPQTDYSVVVLAGGEDIYGGILEDKIEKNFKTKDYKPDFSLEKEVDISVIDAYQGSKFYVNTVNIKQVDIALKQISYDEFKNAYSDAFIDFKNRQINLDQNTWYGHWNIELDQNQKDYTLMNLDEIRGEKLSPGFYYLEVSAPNVMSTLCTYAWQTDNPGCTEIQKIEKTMFVVTESALAVKQSANQLLVWATDLKTGAPVGGMNITASKDNKVYSGITDLNGIAKINIPTDKDAYNNDFMILGQKSDNQTFVHTTWSEGVAPWNFNLDYQTIAPEYYVYLYSDRPIYRPGQEVNFKGIVRQEKDYKLNLPSVDKVSITVMDAEGNNIYVKELKLSGNGTFEDSLTLGQNITTGEYSIVAEIDDKNSVSWQNHFYYDFKVYEYRKPEYKLDITSTQDEYINGQTAKITIDAGYFFGAPMPNTDVKWTVKGSDYYFILPEKIANKITGDWFSFSEDGYFCYWGCGMESELVSQGKVKTDENGQATIDIPFNLNTKKNSQIYTLEVTAFDQNNQSVSNRINIPVHKGDFYIGIRNRDYVGNIGENSEFEILTINPQGNFVGNKNIKVSVFERNWNTVKRKSVDGYFYYENTYDDKLIETKNIKSDGDGRGKVNFNFKQGGDYVVTASAKDNSGNEVRSTTRFYVSSGDFINWGNENNDQIELIPDKMEYQIGDTAKILIKSPYKDAYALITYEKNNVLDQRIEKITSNSQTFEVPITDKFLPNTFISVVLSKGNLNAEGDGNIAGFKVGYAVLQVNTASKKLNIQVSSNKQRYNPGDTVKINLKTTDYTGKAVPSELSVSVVDESVLSLTESVTADLLNVFYRKRLLAVSFADTLTKALARINVQIDSGMKGGGGGNTSKRTDFKDTAFYRSEVFTDENGEGVVEFELPDNLTSWQVLAIGISNDQKNNLGLVGSDKYSFVVNKDLLIRTVLPRFMVNGDEMEISAIIHNYLPEKQKLTVSLNVEGIELIDFAEKEISLDSNQNQKLNWKIKVNGKEKAKIIFKVISSDGKYSDEIEQILPISESSFPEVVSLNKVISEDKKEIEKIWLPENLNLNKGGVKLSLTSSLIGNLGDSIDYLINYSYYCTEQIISRIYPIATITKLVGQDVFKINNSEKMIETDLQQLYKNQQANGGFGLWINSRSNAYLTAYVVEALNKIESLGYSVDVKVKNSAVKYLQELVNKGVNDENDVNLSVNTKAYILFVLSEIGQGDLALNNNLYESKTNLSVASKAFLAMSFGKINEKQKNANTGEKIDSLLKDIENSLIITDRGAYIKEKSIDYRIFDSNLKSASIALRAFNRLDSDNVIIPKLLNHLLIERQTGFSQSTQENAIMLISVLEYMKDHKELSPALTAQVLLNGEGLFDENFKSENLGQTIEKLIPLNKLLSNNMENELAIQKTGQGSLYANISMEYYLPLNQQKAQNSGMDVIQEYFDINDTQMTKPLNSLKVGQNVHSKITLIVPEDRYFVMIEDYLPAGLEGVDFNLKTTEQGLLEEDICEFDDCYNWYFNHSEIRDDKVMFFADFLPKGVYELDYYLRATSVGKFADLPTLAQEIYFPEVFGRSIGRTFEVLN